jgi:hypothetical protein
MMTRRRRGRHEVSFADIMRFLLSSASFSFLPHQSRTQISDAPMHAKNPDLVNLKLHTYIYSEGASPGNYPAEKPTPRPATAIVDTINSMVSAILTIQSSIRSQRLYERTNNADNL